MMDMCTALRRVRGTLLSRGPWVMDGQLLLGTRPALWTHIHRHVIETLWLFMLQYIPYVKASGRCSKQRHMTVSNYTIVSANTHLCISGGSRLIFALCSITSLATLPLKWNKNKLGNKIDENKQNCQFSSSLSIVRDSSLKITILSLFIHSNVN